MTMFDDYNSKGDIGLEIVEYIACFVCILCFRFRHVELENVVY